MTTGVWKDYRDGGTLSLEQALEVTENPRLYRDEFIMIAAYVLGKYVREQLLKMKEIANGL